MIQTLNEHLDQLCVPLTGSHSPSLLIGAFQIWVNDFGSAKPELLTKDFVFSSPYTPLLGKDDFIKQQAAYDVVKGNRSPSSLSFPSAPIAEFIFEEAH
jgi:hypothetical protein